MYQRTERPLTAAERERLEWEHARAGEHVWTARAVYAVTGLLVFGLLPFWVVMAIRGHDSTDVVGYFCGGVAVLFAAFVHYAATKSCHESRRLRRQLREALADGFVNVERVATCGLTYVLLDLKRGWCVLDVEDGQLLAYRCEFIPQAPNESGDLSTPVQFECVTTRRHRLLVESRPMGRSTLTTKPDEVFLYALRFEDPADIVPQLLDTSPIFTGRLDDLGAGMANLCDLGPGTAAGSATRVRWFDLQASIEQSFDVRFGPRGLLNDRPFTADDVRAAVTARTSAAVVQQASPGVAFPHVRAALADACGVPPNRVRPSARLDDLLPRRGRAVAVWRLRELLPEVPLEVAGMSAAAVVTMLLLIGLLYAVGVPVVQAVDNAARAADIGRSWWVIPYALAGMVVVPAVFVGGMGLAVAASLWLWRNHLPVRIPADCATAGDLARYLARRGHWNQVVPVPADPWPAVRAAVAAAAGRRPFEVARDTRLADLGFPPAGPG